MTAISNFSSPDSAVPPFTVRKASWVRDAEALRTIRLRVFVEEQRVPVEMEWDGLDEHAVHILAETDRGQAVGAARLLITGQIGRMAVLPAWRAKGIGSALLNEALRIAAREGIGQVWLNAQVSALVFYRKHRFVPQGKRFSEAGIPHLRMVYQGKLSKDK